MNATDHISPKGGRGRPADQEARRTGLNNGRCALAAGLGLLLSAAAHATEQRLSIPPHQTDERLSDAEPPHLVVYDTEAVAAPLLVVWLGGTGGKPASGPRLFYALAEPLPGANPHRVGISNPAYQALWEQMLGSAGR